MSAEDFSEHHEDDQYISKTQRKQEMLERQKLGEEIVGLGPNTIKSLPLDDELLAAILLAQRIRNKREGYRRQLQLIGKLLRGRDIEPLEQALTQLRNSHLSAQRQFHALEDIRERLLQEKGGDDALQQLMQEHPNLDRQRLRQLVRQCKKERQLQKPPKAFREIFQYLKSAIEE